MPAVAVLVAGFEVRQIANLLCACRCAPWTLSPELWARVSASQSRCEPDSPAPPGAWPARARTHFSFPGNRCSSPSTTVNRRIYAAQFRHPGDRHVFQKISIVTDHHGRERRVPQQVFQPLDSRQIQVVGGLVQQQNIGLLGSEPELRQSPAACANRPRVSRRALRSLRIRLAPAFPEAAPRARPRA